MPLKAFKELPKNLVEWGRYFQSLVITPDPNSVGEDQLKDGEVTFQKIQAVTPDRLLGRDTSPAGVIQELEVSGGLEFTGSGIRRGALTGDVTAAAGSGTTAFREMSAVSVLGRSDNSTGSPAEIAAASNGQFLRRSGDALGFGAIADGDLPSSIARDSEVTSAISALNLASGTYTPTITGVTNVDATTAYSCQYMRVGTTVTVSGRVDVDATAAAATDARISLPIASNFSSTVHCAGTAWGETTAVGAAIIADVSNDTALITYTAPDGSNRAFVFIFTYRII